MRTFLLGETVECYSEVKTLAGAYVDPTTSITVKITDPDETVQVNDEAMAKSDTGKYAYYYTLDSSPASGWWVAEVTVTDGTKITKTTGGFRVEA